MKIQLDLTHHCIETEIRRLHEAAMSRYFKRGTGDKKAVEKELVLLENALTAFDFPRLRSGWSVLAGGDDRPVSLHWEDNRRPCLQVDDQRVVPPAKEA